MAEYIIRSAADETKILHRGQARDFRSFIADLLSEDPKALRGASISGVNLSRTKFPEGTDLSGAVLTSVDLSRTFGDGVVATGAQFYRCPIGGSAEWLNWDLRGATVLDCIAPSISLRGSKTDEHTTFRKNVLRDANLRDMATDGARFIENDLTGARVYGGRHQKISQDGKKVQTKFINNRLDGAVISSGEKKQKAPPLFFGNRYKKTVGPAKSTSFKIDRSLDFIAKMTPMVASGYITEEAKNFIDPQNSHHLIYQNHAEIINYCMGFMHAHPAIASALGAPILVQSALKVLEDLFDKSLDVSVDAGERYMMRGIHSIGKFIGRMENYVALWGRRETMGDIEKILLGSMENWKKLRRPDDSRRHIYLPDKDVSLLRSKDTTVIICNKMAAAEILSYAQKAKAKNTTFVMAGEVAKEGRDLRDPVNITFASDGTFVARFRDSLEKDYYAVFSPKGQINFIARSDGQTINLPEFVREAAIEGTARLISRFLDSQSVDKSEKFGPEAMISRARIKKVGNLSDPNAEISRERRRSNSFGSPTP